MSSLCVKVVLQGDVTGWTTSTSNKIIQFHALSIFQFRERFRPFVTVRSTLELMQKSFPQGVISPLILDYTTTMMSNYSELKITSSHLHYFFDHG